MLLQRVRPPLRVLISDDDEGCRTSLADALESRGYDVLAAGTGREAIEIARRHELHVAILDVQMPDISGPEAATIIRREARVRLPCILMSGGMTAEMLARQYAAEYDSFLPKPVDLLHLRQVVEELFKRYYEFD